MHTPDNMALMQRHEGTRCKYQISNSECSSTKACQHKNNSAVKVMLHLIPTVDGITPTQCATKHIMTCSEASWVTAIGGWQDHARHAAHGRTLSFVPSGLKATKVPSREADANTDGSRWFHVTWHMQHEGKYHPTSAHLCIMQIIPVAVLVGLQQSAYRQAFCKTIARQQCA